MKIALTVAVAALSGVLTQAATHEFDIVIYGSSPAGNEELIDTGTPSEARQN